MKPRDIEVADRFLRQWTVVSGVAKYPTKPPECRTEIAAKACRKSEVVGDQADVFLVRLLFGKLESKTELLFGFGPFAFVDQAKAARVSAFHRRLACFGNQLLCLRKEFESFVDLSAAARKACERMQRLGLVRRTVLIAKRTYGGTKQRAGAFGFALYPRHLGKMQQRTRMFFKRPGGNLFGVDAKGFVRSGSEPIFAVFGDQRRSVVKLFGVEQELDRLFPVAARQITVGNTLEFESNGTSTDLGTQSPSKESAKQRMIPAFL